MTNILNEIMVAQIELKPANIEHNKEKIKLYYSQAVKENKTICLLPEIAITGYPCEDLWLQKEFIKKAMEAAEEIISLTKGQKTVLILTTPYKENPKSSRTYNAALVIKNGEIIARSYKKHLPNYKVFDEQRYFCSGDGGSIFELDGKKFALLICEDFWYGDFTSEINKAGCEALLVPNASPFYIGKHKKRLEVIKSRYKEANCPIFYCNQICAQDGLVFEGRSVFYSDDQHFEMPALHEATEFSSPILEDEKETLKSIYNTIVYGTKKFLEYSPTGKVLLGLSGGIDSAMVATIAVDALGAENVTAVFMPSQFTEDLSHQEAQKLANNLGIKLHCIAIEKLLSDFCVEVSIHTNHEIQITGLAHENTQARIRGNLLMAISNATSTWLLTTGNKSELAVGYTTIYGDSCGAFNPIKDVYKTMIFKLALLKNEMAGQEIIPEATITRPPTAELRNDQKDSDALPPYEILDQILHMHIEEDMGAEEIIASSDFNIDTVNKVLKLVKNSEHKRYQSAPGVKISTRSFDKERRWLVNY